MDVECSCTPPPNYEGPCVWCDVHGSPSVAYRHGLGEGRRQERELVTLELAQERYAYSQLASENADLADEVARLRARDEAGAAVAREFTRNGFWAPGTELRAVLDALVRAHGQEES